MLNKKIVFTKPNVAEVLTEEVPAIGDGDVLVRLTRSTISSGTERANLSGNPYVTWFDTSEIAKFPRITGYSSSGVVEKVGKNVRSLVPGDRVANYWSVHAKYNVLPEKNVVKLPGSLSFSDGALLHIATFPMAAIRKCRIEAGESAIVMGQGVLGMIAVKLLRAAGAVPVISVDPIAEKREQALKIGADYAFDPNDAHFVENVKSVTGGGVNVAIEVTGVGVALNQCLDCMARLGRVALLGCTRSSDFTVDYYHKVHGPGIILIGAHTNARPNSDSYPGYWTTRDDMAAVCKLIKFGRMSLSDMIAEVHSPEEAPAVYERLLKDKSFPLVQFDWDKI
ncbi:MAG: zinc-binding alcohol dehydrogenase [Firmicutes bacterium]|nr:zinc-binding alcohol dehydrogenase [Bacillota bacterium]MDY5531362.1 zinc-binding alcohol dehydrogenase [Pumilibacteraceae bacterium]